MKHLLFTAIAAVIIFFTIRTIGIPSGEEVPDDGGYTSSDDYYLSYDSYVIDLITATPISPPIPEKTPSDPSGTSHDGFTEVFHGIFFQDNGNTIITRALLNDPDVRFMVGHPSSTMTVCNQLDYYNLQVAVNGSGFYADGTVDPFGMVDGIVYTTYREPGITIAITEDNQVVFAQMNEDIPKNTRYALTAFNRLVYRGEVLSRFYPDDKNYKASYGLLALRTIISTDGEFLTIVQFASPVTVAFAGEYVLKNFPDTTDVFNFDGAGSTNGCVEGIGPTVDTGRPVANTFGIFSVPVR